MADPLRNVALATAALTAATFALALATPPLSGPFCTADCFAYPYDGIAARFPRDYLWMLLALPQLAATLLLLAHLHERAAPAARPQSLAALGFGIIAIGTLFVAYWTQLAVIQPSVLQGESDGIALLTQYNPHGLFIAHEEVAYLLLALSLLLIAPATPGRAARAILRLGALAAALATAGIVLTLGHGREYLLEVALIFIDWLVLTAVATLLALRPGG